MRIRRILWTPAIVLVLAAGAAAQTPALSDSLTGKVIVHIRASGSAKISSAVAVKLYTISGAPMELRSSSDGNSRIVFEDVPVGEYIVDVRAAGFLPALDEVSVLTADAVAYVFVDLRTANSADPPAGDAKKAIPPAIPPKARKELQHVSGLARWAPPSVDDRPPVLFSETSCKLPEVLAGAAKRARALAANLEQVTATERVEQADIGRNGKRGDARTNVFDYLVSIVETRPGNLVLEENRIPLSRSATPPRYMTNGLGGLALIFHPYYVKDYEMRCEGLTELNGQPAWSLFFQQRADVPSRIRSYRVQDGIFRVALKGRAWIAANNFQVLRMETDLVAPVKGLRLEEEHLRIEYKPVEFKTRKIRLWLPADAEMYANFRGRRFFHHHSFTDYKVFYVDVSQKVADQNP